VEVFKVVGNKSTFCARLKGLGLSHPEKRRARNNLIAVFSYLIGVCRDDRAGPSSEMHKDETKG